MFTTRPWWVVKRKKKNIRAQRRVSASATNTTDLFSSFLFLQHPLRPENGWKTRTWLVMRQQRKGSKRSGERKWKENTTHIFHWAKWGSAVWTQHTDSRWQTHRREVMVVVVVVGEVEVRVVQRCPLSCESCGEVQTRVGRRVTAGGSTRGIRTSVRGGDSEINK